jgi:hypothetical protein
MFNKIAYIAPILMVLLFLSANSAFSSTLILDTVAAWNFNETSGDTVYDQSGNGRHGRFNKTPIRVPGLEGSAVRFDGSTWAVIKNDGAFNLHGSFRAEMTFKLPYGQYPNSGRWFSNHQTEHLSGYMLASRSSCGFTFEAYDSYRQIKAETQGGDFQPGEWVAFAMEYDSAEQKFSYFLNDTLRAQFNVDFNGIHYEKTPFLIGTEVLEDSTLGQLPCYGIIDDLKIMRIVRRVSDGTLAHWKFNEASGDSLYDLSGNGHHGRFNKTPLRVPGLEGNAVRFDGTTWAVVPNDGSFDLRGDFQIEVTYQFTAGTLPDKGRYLANHAPFMYGYCLASRDDLGFTFEAYDGASQIKAETEGGMWATGGWNVLKMVHDSAEKTITYYVNDVLKTTLAADLENIAYDGTPFTIGCELTAELAPGSMPFHGIMDEIKIMTVVPKGLSAPVVLLPPGPAEITASDLIAWTAGTNSPSALYHLQIATYPLFTQGLVADLPGLAATDVSLAQLAGDYALPKYTLLFVRVRAEEAGVFSSWSPVSSFYFINGTGPESDGRAAAGGVSVSPNPFNPSTRISFSVRRPGPAVVSVYDMKGRKIRTLFSGPVDAGRHECAWDGRDDAGRGMTSGTYLLRLESVQYRQSLKLMLLK